MMIVRGVSKFKQRVSPDPVGHGYIIIPSKISSRDNYIASCLRRERVTILGADGRGMIKDCYISKEAILNLNFPKDDKTLGDLVVYVINGYNNLPIIIGNVSKDKQSRLLEEGEFRIEKTLNGKTVKIVGKASSGDLFINVDGGEDSNGAIILNATSKEGGSIVKVVCDGDVDIYADEKVKLHTCGSLTIESRNIKDDTKSSKIELSEENVSISASGKTSIGEGSSPMVLGDKNSEVLESLRTILDTLNAELVKFTIATSSATVEPTLAPASIVLNSALQQLVIDLEEVSTKIGKNNSENSFTD